MGEGINFRPVWMTINEENQEVLRITLLKFLGSEKDKREFLRQRGWTPRYTETGKWDHRGQESFYTEWKTIDEAMDCEIRFVLTGAGS